MTHRAAPNQVSFSIAQLEAWAPGVTNAEEWREWARGMRSIERLGEPPLRQMAPMLRRHAGRLGRLACSPAYDSLGELRDVPMVFSARYGEVSRSVELLTALSGGDELSPTTFGLSVHNAVPGLFSMARKETANSVSLAAGDDSAEVGVIEACGLLQDGAEQVLLVVADCPLPSIYENFEDSGPIAFGWSCLVRPPDGNVVTLSWVDSDEIVRGSEQPSALSALPVFLGESAQAVRVSKRIEHRRDSDPSIEIIRGSTRVGQNDDSDPSTKNAHADPKRRIWRWSRNA